MPSPYCAITDSVPSFTHESLAFIESNLTENLFGFVASNRTLRKIFRCSSAIWSSALPHTMSSSNSWQTSKEQILTCYTAAHNVTVGLFTRLKQGTFPWIETSPNIRCARRAKYRGLGGYSTIAVGRCYYASHSLASRTTALNTCFYTICG
eukprot:8763180-Pyramimonas_sp.AAC.2